MIGSKSGQKSVERIRKTPPCVVHVEERGIVLRLDRGCPAKQKAGRALRDGILKIVTKNGDNYYVLFRVSKIVNKRLTLSTGTGLKVD